jgi:glycosyltransferase involved in cell wall biosynthesis
MTGRIPKGQYRRYRHLARVLVPSRFVREKVLAENPALAPVTRVCGYPIDWRRINQPAEMSSPSLPPPVPGQVTLGFVGRIHEEKGLLLLARALQLVGRTPGLPPWRLLLCGPSDTARGGSGPAFRRRLLQELALAIPSDRCNLLDPQFNDRTLAGVYRRINIFCYPSLSAQGETFGVAVAEAMAAGAVPVVSGLACFADFVHAGENGLVFDHTVADAAARLATALVQLLQDAALRQRLATAARHDVQVYDYGTYADTLLADFAQLTARIGPAS